MAAFSSLSLHQKDTITVTLGDHAGARSCSALQHAWSKVRATLHCGLHRYWVSGLRVNGLQERGAPVTKQWHWWMESLQGELLEHAALQVAVNTCTEAPRVVMIILVSRFAH